MEQIIVPTWPAPSHVKAMTTTRLGGVSESPFTSFNLGAHVGDEIERVMQNRQQLQALVGMDAAVQWLNQVHGTHVVSLPKPHLEAADAAYTASSETICAVLTADCLPVVFCDEAGSEVAVAHAGWRGLCDGVLENTLAQFSNPLSVMAWLGPAIGPASFEVGGEVRDAFMAKDAAAEQAFIPSENAQKWLGNLYLLARQRLAAAGCNNVFGGDFCTYSDAERFFSYRRDQQTGRMATLIWIEK